MTRLNIPWHLRLVQLGRRRTMLLLTTYSVGASVALVAVFYKLFDGQPENLTDYFVPAVLVPLFVAPLVIHVLLGLVAALEAAYAQAAQQQAELQRVRQLDLVGRLASGLAHDFNNLLTVVRANVDALGGAAASDELAAIDDAALRGARLTRRLLSISQHDDVTVAAQPLAPLLHETQDLLRRVLPTSVRLSMPAEVPDIVLSLDRDAVQQALLNLALNARDAMGEQGELTLRVYRVDTSDGAWLVVEVRDNGPGMAPALLERATEPFFTTKAAHEGTGLGLAIVRRSMEQHGGRLMLESTVGVGTSAALWFPIAPSGAVVNTAETPATAPPSSVLSPTTYQILVVDDEPHVRRATERTLQRLGHRVTGVANIASAKALLEAGAAVDVIVSDVMMPGGTGLDLVSQLRSTGDGTPVLLVSGFSLDAFDDSILSDPSVAFLAKPWALAALVDGIEHVRRGATRRSPAN